MILGRGIAVLTALCLGASACSGPAEETVGGPRDPVVISDVETDEEFLPVDQTEDEIAPVDGNTGLGLDSDPARCLAIPQVNPIGGVKLLVTNVGTTLQEIAVYRDGELQVTVSPEPGGNDPKLSDDPYSSDRFDQISHHTDFDTPLGSTLRYTATTGDDPLGGDTCGLIDVPELWPTPTCYVEVIDGFPNLILGEGFGLRSYRRNGEPLTLSAPPGAGSTRLFDAEPPVGVPLRYTIISDNEPWPETASDCGTVTIDTAPVPEGLLEQAEKRLQHTLGPFWYTTITPLCSGCDPDLEVTYAFSYDGTVMGTWRNGFEADPSEDPWRIPPQQLATHLLAQRDAGKAVEVDFVGATSVIDRWTIDGAGAQVLCASVDTAPLERRTPFCEPEFFSDED